MPFYMPNFYCDCPRHHRSREEKRRSYKKAPCPLNGLNAYLIRFQHLVFCLLQHHWPLKQKGAAIHHSSISILFPISPRQSLLLQVLLRISATSRSAPPKHSRFRSLKSHLVATPAKSCSISQLTAHQTSLNSPPKRHTPESISWIRQSIPHTQRPATSNINLPV